jgi:hypothetical protein
MPEMMKTKLKEKQRSKWRSFRRFDLSHLTTLHLSMVNAFHFGDLDYTFFCFRSKVGASSSLTLNQKKIKKMQPIGNAQRLNRNASK